MNVNRKSDSDGLATSLRAFAHPLTWVAIIALVVNDHILKLFAPSWLSGKLSDFAGLFFFPFLIAVMLSLVLDPFRWSARRIGGIAFGLSGSWFFLLKTWPWANSVTSDLASFLLGFPTQYALDPTDLLALASLWPAWKLWNRPGRTAPRKVALIALAAGSLATMATSPPVPIPRIDRLVQVEGNLYASDTDYPSRFIAHGREGGVLWDFVWDESVSEQVQRALDEEVAMPIIVCNPLDEQTCYRITGQEEIEISSDGGQTWEIAWRVPPGRRAFLDYSAGDKRVDLGPYDMLFFEQQGMSCLLVAMGNEGVIRRCMPDGPWERYAVYEACPTPFLEEDVVDALFIMRRKVNIWIGITLLILVFSCSVGWRSIVGRVKMDKEKGDSGRWVLSPVIITTILGALSGILSGVAWDIGMSSPIPTQFLREPFLVGLALLPLAGFVLTWRRIASLIGPSQVTWIALWCLLTTLLSLASGVTPQVLWATGTIADYTTAQSIAGLCAIGFAIGGLYMVYRTGKGLSIQLDAGQDS